MVVGEVAERADVVVIGAGPGGYTAALRCADLGKHTILIDRGPVGGTCLNVGCIPSKVLIHAADTAALARRSRSWGVNLDATVDATQIVAHSDEVVDQLTGGVRSLLSAAGVEVWSGEARFSKSNRLAVVDGTAVRHLEFSHCIVATGSRPTELPSLPTNGTTVVNSTGALRLESVPDRMIIVGGGYIGVELGTAWAKLGSTVTIVEAEDRLLPGMDPMLGREVTKRLKRLGVTIHLSSFASAAVEPPSTNAVARVEISARSTESAGVVTTTEEPSTAMQDTLEAERVIVAVGRTPNTDDLGLDVAGITVDQRGLIPVSPNRSATPRIFAIGDITDGPALAHKATAEAEVAARAINGEPAAFDPAGIPEVVFSDPEVASVGHTPASARFESIAATVARFPYAAGSRSRTVDDTAGFVQLVADEAGSLIGAQLAGAGVAELIGELTLGIELGATIEDLATTIHAHPTMSEAIGEAAHVVLGTPLHVRR